MGREFQISKTTKFGDLLYNSAKALNTAELNLIIMGFPCGSAGKESTCKVGRPGFDPWVGKIPWRRERLPTPVFWPGEFHGLYRSQRVGHDSATFTFNLILVNMAAFMLCVF